MLLPLYSRPVPPAATPSLGLRELVCSGGEILDAAAEETHLSVCSPAFRKSTQLPTHPPSPIYSSIPPPTRKHYLSTYLDLGAVMGTDDRAVNTTGTIPRPHGVFIHPNWERQ